MQKNTQFAAIKWIKNELQLSIKQARSLLESAQVKFSNDALESFEAIAGTLSNNLEVANDDVGSILCKELTEVAKYIRLECASEKEDRSVADLMQGLVILNDHIENISHGYNVDSRGIGVIIDVMRKRQGKPDIQKSLLFVLDLSSIGTTAENNQESLGIEELVGEVRPQFQRCLLGWFQDKNRDASLEKLESLMLSVSKASSIALIELYFSASSIVLGGLKNRVFGNERGLKSLVGQIDRQLKLIAALGEQRVAMGLPLGLVRQTLYYVARMPAEGEEVLALHEKYNLKASLLSHLGENESIHYTQALASIATSVRDEFKSIKQWLEDIVEQQKPPTGEIDGFINAAEGWSQTLSVIGENELSEVIADFVRRLAFCIYGTSAPEESQLMELAEEWLKIDTNLLEIEAASRVKPLDGDQDQTSADDVEESPLIVTTAKTTLVELATIKEIISEDLDGENESDVRWKEIKQLLNHVQAACHFIELDKPAQLVDDCRLFISTVMDSDGYRVTTDEVCSIADIVSSVEYLLEDVAEDMSVASVALILAEKAALYLVGRIEDIKAFEQNSAVIETEQEQEQQVVVTGVIDEPQETPELVETEGAIELDSDEIEILEIFTEEAGEICVELRDDFNKWREDVSNEESLKDVRRAFHTLKGSGRLAKVDFLSETAWSVESLLNNIIEGELETNDDVVALVGDFVERLPEWVSKINDERPSLEDMSGFISTANSIEENLLNGPQEIVLDITEEEPVVDENVLDPELCDIFSNETTVHLATIQQYMEDHAGLEKVHVNDALFRAMHTIHGCASMAHIDEVEELSAILCEYVRELSESGFACEKRGFYSILSEYHELTAQQIVALNEAEVLMPNHRPLQKLIEENLAGLPDLIAADIADSNEEAEQAAEITVNSDGINIEDEELVGLDDEIIASDVESEVIDNSTADILPFNVSVSAADALNEDLTETDDDEEMRIVFIEEGTELLEGLSEILSSWKEDIANKSYLDPALHNLHTLKGSSLLVGMEEFGAVIHEMESSLEANQENAEPVSEVLISGLLGISDDLLVSLQDTNSKIDSAGVISLIEKLNQDQTVETEKTVVIVEQNETVAKVSEIQKVGEPIQKVASVAKNKDKTVKISNDLLDRLIADVGEVNVSQGQLKQQNKDHENQIKELSITIERLRQQLRKLEIETEAQVLFKVDKSTEDTGFDPLELDRYSQIQQMSRSLLESISDLEDIRDTLIQSDDKMSGLIQKESSLTDTLLEDLFRVRMVEFSRYGSRFERLVRQLGSELDKPTMLTVRGAETEIDRSILNELQTSIEHIIRNSMAHGVESSDKRLAAGKDAKANINLNLSREGSEIHLTISDDGCGIDVERIRKKAIELGHIKETENYTDQDLIQFILKPGFSTADEVSKLAGRGIGMDIVNDTIRRIGGALTINSHSGKGSSFHLIFPYTMAINMALMVKANNVLYAIPNNFIENIVRVPVDVVRDNMASNQPVLVQGDKEYQLHDLSQLLGVEKSHASTGNGRWVNVLLINSRQEKHAVTVDQLMGNKEVVVKPLGTHLELIPWLSGSTVSNEGEIVLMLDLPVLTSIGELEDDQHEIKEIIEAEKIPLIMVVDDSITFRKVATKLLKRQGYEVVEARDGLEAIEKLGDVQPDLFLLDVEMPKMDGFELARYIRHSDEIGNTPIVMVTSRTGEKHQNHAKELRVNDYFGKPFDNKALVKSINDLLEAQYAGA